MNIPGWAIERTHTDTPYMAGRRSGGGAHLLVRIAGYGFTMVIADTPEYAVMAHDAGGAGVLMWRECAGVPDDHVICAEVTMLVDEFERMVIAQRSRIAMAPRGNPVNGQPVRTYAGQADREE